ncbi:MAG: DUF3467 domain-containing protein [Phreatobacter sp.]|jgi:hypothetical protein|uniref:DUF3467 domain-containing protein n=1 Tax=Phreatobacter sp. TaxID=1966341 RepID=UPI0040369CE8
MTDAESRPSKPKAARSAPAKPGEPPVKVNASRLKSTYCNICNASSTREEVVLNFGINQNWDQGRKAFDVELHHRIILNPHAAKRLHLVLGELIAEHERRYGELR